MQKKDPYIGDVGYIYTGKTKRREMKGRLVVVLGIVSDKRGLQLIAQQSRALCKNEIHEIMTTDEADIGPGKIINSVAVIGFFEVTQGGVVLVGQPVSFNGKEIGTIAGFDETHFPNHYNIVVLSSKRFTGLEAGFKLNDKLRIGG
jgi:hypothetical protein